MAFRFHGGWFEEENLKRSKNSLGNDKEDDPKTPSWKERRLMTTSSPPLLLNIFGSEIACNQGLVKIHNVSGYSVVQQTLMRTCNNIRGGLLSWMSSKEFACQCRRPKRFRFDPWVGKSPWRGEWRPTPVFLPGIILWTEKPGGLQLRRAGHDWTSERSIMPGTVPEALNEAQQKLLSLLKLMDSI